MTATLVKPKVSSIVRSQLPEHIREDYQTFLAFLEAYYEYVESTEVDLKTLRDLDTTLDSFIRYFKSELAPNLPYSSVDTRFLLKNIKSQYLAKGSEASVKLLFKILYDKDVTVAYPSTQILRASDGKWNQDVSVFAKITQGNPNDIVGKLVDVVTPNKIIRVLVDRRQYVEIEVERAIKVSEDTYEFLIDRRFFGDINVGDRLRYRDDTNGIYFSAEIQSTTVKLEVLQPGSGFRVGDIYNVKNFNGTGSIMKVSAIDSNGGIKRAQFIKFGIGYSTDFTTTISSLSGQDLAGTAGTVIQKVGNTMTITEGMDGFAEIGSMNSADYNIDPSGSHAMDGTYAGTVLREFGISSIDSTVTDTNPAIIKCTLGALAKYPGYYINNDSFLDDAVFVQDSRYYQAYSYVIRIDEKLDNYKTIVKNLLHPAGMAIFGEYDIRNEFDISLELESLIKILAIAQNEELSTSDSQFSDIAKTITNSTLNYDAFYNADTRTYSGTPEGQYVTMQEIGIALDGTRTMPYWTTNKPLGYVDGINTHLNYNGSYDGEGVTMTEVGIALDGTRVNPVFKTLVANTLTPTSGDAGFHKALNSTHVINDGTTVDNESVMMISESGSDSTRINPAFYTATLNTLSATSGDAGFHKTLNTTSFNYDNVLDNNTTPAVEPTYAMGYNAVMPDGTGNTTTRTGLQLIPLSGTLSITDAGVIKTLNSTQYTHYLYDGVTADTDLQPISDTDASSATDLNRTTPAFALTTTFPDTYYIVGTATWAGNNSATMTDSGGFLDFNPYGEAGYFLNDGGLYVGTQINF